MYGKKGMKFKSYADAHDLTKNGPLSVHLKVDIEGSEWAVFDTLTDADWGKVALFDVEVHFCAGAIHGLGWEHLQTQIYKQLRKWKHLFYVTQRGGISQYTRIMKARGLPETWADAGCTWQDGKYQMMTLSMVNKQLVDT